MAAPTVQTVPAVVAVTSGTSNAVTMPASIAAGDLLLIFASHDTGAAVSASAGWSIVANDLSAASEVRLICFGKIAAGSDTCTITASNNDIVIQALRITGHGVSNVTTDIVKATAATGTGSADPPAPTSTTRDWLYIASCGISLTTGNTITAQPAGYTTDRLQTSASSTTSCALGLAHKATTATTTDDPAVFTNTSRPYVAQTIMISPLTRRTNSFEGGTDTTTISAGNSGGTSGDAFNSVSIGAGNTLAFSVTHIEHGTLAGKCITTGVAGAGTNSVVQYTGSWTDFYWRMYLYLDVFPGTAAIRVVSYDDGANFSGVNLDSTRHITQANASGNIGSASTTVIPTGQWVRLEGHVKTTATTLSEVKIFLTADSATPDETVTNSAPTGIGNPTTTIGFGPRNAAVTFYLDDVGYDVTGYMGPSVAGTLVTRPLIVSQAVMRASVI